MNSTAWIELVTKTVQSVFYIVGAVVAVLTYTRAKKTILQPIRTEIFKVQLQELSAALKLFAGQGEIALRGSFGFPQLEQANIVAMYDAYAALFFDIKIDASKRPYNQDRCPSSLFTASHVEKYIEIADDHLTPDKPEKSDSPPDPRVRAALWNDYEHGHILLPKEHTEMIEKTQEALESPLLPKRCAELMESLLEIVGKDVMLLGNVLTECAREMPQKYPTLDLLSKADFGWIHNRYNHRFYSLHPKAKSITDYVRSYWEIDRLPD